VARLRVLRGRIPICAGCKQVRDHTGAWNRLEAYLEEHSHAELRTASAPSARPTSTPAPSPLGDVR